MERLTEEQVKEALATVHDPEIGMDIVELGLVYDIDITDDNHVRVEMTLTTPGCPLGDGITAMVDTALRGVGASGTAVDLVWSPPWTPDMMSEDAKMQLGWGMR